MCTRGALHVDEIILLTMARGRKLLLPSLTSLSVLDMRWRSLSRTVHNRAMGILLGSIGAVSVLACQGAFSNAPEGSEALVTQDLPSASTHFRRLTHVEWENTVQDLFGLSAPSLLSAAFRNDPRQGGFLFASQGDALDVDQSLATSYQRAALALAASVTGDEARLTAIAPARSDDEARAMSFIATFGTRVHRHKLTAEQSSAYLTIYRQGLTAYDDQTGFGAGVRMVLEAMLQSPFFLYRVESSTLAAEGTIALDGYERASRLSYFFWETMPDVALFKAAESGELDDAEGVREQAERLVADPRARRVVEGYFASVLDVERFQRISPSTTAFPNVPDNLAELAEEEARQFIGEVVYAESGGIVDLLTSNVTYVNADLASIYGLSGTFGAKFTRTELDPALRSGFLTQIGFLASHATSIDPDPIHRGVFLAKNISCLKIAAPPDAVPALPVPGDRSNRQVVSEHTEKPEGSCKNCHLTIINPFGFVFEAYDAIGGYRTVDRGHPVDSSASPLVDGKNVAVNDGVELSKKLAASRPVHDCFAGNLVQFAQGRALSKQDEATITAVGKASLAGELSFRDMMVEIATSRAFLDRALDEVEAP